MRADAIHIFQSAVRAVQPATLIAQHVQRTSDALHIGGRRYALVPGRPVFIFGAGKAAAAMAQALEEQLNGLPLQGLVITKHAHSLPLQHIAVAEAGHPVPDIDGVQATSQLLQLLQDVQEDDVLIFLLSGGASALLIDYPPGSSLDEIQTVFTLLLQSGADIHEMNTVRKHLSAVKGGQLARRITAKAFCTIILSDVTGDNLDVIGSGPTVPDPGTFADARAVLEKYQLLDKVPLAVQKYIGQGCMGKIPDTPKPGDARFDGVYNFLAGTNKIALEAAAATASALGYTTHILTSTASGDAEQLAHWLIQKAINIGGNTPVCLLAGGESTVRVTGHGLGGRNQHLALAAGLALPSDIDITLLSAGTDGTDGPTDAAGAVTDSALMQAAQQQGLNAQQFLEQHDAYHFFEQAGGLLKTGPTQTNVMDIMVVLIKNPSLHLH
jgi:glycerate 2-kinase